MQLSILSDDFDKNDIGIEIGQKSLKTAKNSQFLNAEKFTSQKHILNWTILQFFLHSGLKANLGTNL